MELNPTDTPPLKQIVLSVALPPATVQKSTADLKLSVSLALAALLVAKGELWIVTSLHMFQVSVQKSVVELVGDDDTTSLVLQRTGKS